MPLPKTDVPEKCRMSWFVFEVFFDVPGLGQGGTAGVEIVPEGLEKPLLVDSDEACPSGLPREVYKG